MLAFFFLFSKTIKNPVMSSEILAVLEYMEKEKGISREDMIATIEGAVKAAAERAINSRRRSGRNQPEDRCHGSLDPIGSAWSRLPTRPGNSFGQGSSVC